MIVERTWNLTTNSSGAAGFSTPHLMGWFLEAIDFEEPDSSNKVQNNGKGVLFLAKRDGTNGRRIASFNATTSGFTNLETFIDVQGHYVPYVSPSTMSTNQFPQLISWRGFNFSISAGGSGKKVNVTLYLTDGQVGCSSLSYPTGFKPTYFNANLPIRT